MFDPELPAGFQDADFEQRELEAAGNEAYAQYARCRKLAEAGEVGRAAVLCPHGWCGGAEGGIRCYHCGSLLSDNPWEPGCVVLVPCQEEGRWEKG